MIGSRMLEAWLRSLTYNIRNKSGPSIDPWGTPHLICKDFQIFLRTINCFLSDK